METRLVWKGNLAFDGEGAQSSTRVTIDASKSAGGEESGPSPMELFLMSIAGCASIDIIMILRKRRKTINDYWVEITGERRAEKPSYFTAIHMHFHLVSDQLTDKEVSRAIELSESTYCSAWNNLDPTKTTVTYDYTIHLPEEEQGEK